jgi:hypothetical protein
VRLIHGTHAHEIGTIPAGPGASFTPLTNHDADSSYVVALTATDNDGASTMISRTITPRTTTVTVGSEPSGAPISYGGFAHVTPFSATTAVGFETTASTASTFASGGITRTFDRWADGPATEARTFSIPEGGVTLVARYTSPPVVPDPGPPLTPTTPVTPTAPLVPGVVPPIRLLLDVNRSTAAIRRGRLSGSAAPNARTVSVDVALRPAGTTVRGCRWWSLRRRGLAARRTSCRSPAWMRTTLARRGGVVTWRLSLGRAPAPGHWVLLFRGTAGDGAVTRTLVNGRLSATLVVPAPRPASRSSR